MQTVTVSPKFQVVIPKKIREQLHIVAGQKLLAMPYGHHIQLVAIQPPAQLRGLLQGTQIDTSTMRDKTDRL